MTYLAIATGYNFTLRPGHITYMGPTATDHRYRFGDVTIEALEDGHFVSLIEWVESGLVSGERTPVGVFILKTESSKTHGVRAGGDVKLNFICRGNDFENQYFEYFSEWLSLCGVDVDAKHRGDLENAEAKLPVLQRPLFSRIHPISRLYKRSIVKEITNAIRQAAEAFGLDRRAFTGRSLRIGGCTTAVAAGASSEEVLRATGHANVETSRIYTRTTKHKATSLGYGLSVGVQDIRRMTVSKHK